MLVTSGGLALSIAAAVAGPLLAAAPAHAGSGRPTVADLTAASAVTAAGASGSTVGRSTAGTPGWAAPVPSGAPQPPPPVTTVFVEVSPSTVERGFLVGIRASCRDNSVPAIVVSDAFGRVQVQPQGGVLTAAPMVRERTLPGNYRVKLECPDEATASTMLQVVEAMGGSRSGPSRGAPSRGPATGFGGSAGGGIGGLLLPGGLALSVTGLVVWIATARRPRTVRGAARR